MTVITEVWELYNKWIYLHREISTRRSLLSTLLLALAATTVYIVFVKNLGPNFMKYRKPFRIEKIIQVYNLVQAVANAYIALTIVRLYFESRAHYSLWCEPIDDSRNQLSEKAKELTTLNFYLKIADLIQPMLFILRKRSTHTLSYSHVAFNVSAILVAWFTIHFLAGGSTAFIGLVTTTGNAFIYTFYTLASFNVRYQNSKLWEKYLALMPIVQLGILNLYGAQLILFQSCGYPKLIFCLMIPPNMFFLLLYLEYYVSIYFYAAITLH